ncbi:hypothetical protein AB0K48_47380, partial [Nonomuraea sp. NPDC055795]
MIAVRVRTFPGQASIGPAPPRGTGLAALTHDEQVGLDGFAVEGGGEAGDGGDHLGGVGQVGQDQ